MQETLSGNTESESNVIATYDQGLNCIICIYKGKRPNAEHRIQIDDYLWAFIDPNPNCANVIGIEITNFSTLFSELWRRSSGIKRDQPIPVQTIVQQSLMLTGGFRSEAQRFAHTLIKRISTQAQLAPFVVNQLIDRYTLPPDQFIGASET